MIELVDYNEIYGNGIGEEKAAGKRTRRRGGSGKKKADAEVVVAEAKIEEAVAAPIVAEALASAEADDLIKIEGIGPKVAEIFAEAGITTFAQLASKTKEELEAILNPHGGVYVAMDPTTWPQQAQLAADGKWEEFEVLLAELKGGKEQA
ncbi:MAG TPA: helix-hairpin-helix domain-containing protein [Niabella sp.]|nr:helix-hairpin-helix domain-containing protein [Niabella sp.]HOZ98527.1 helix-hairpin-helix domain-containing protein [Niabella sp.]HQW13223.1 helix-hairpin-helix domain-containing protein [Niabella sp.]HQX18737.1 helix-hairpin-helix domain-containing protein [Niabella sp.]HQX41623.1 helix-hairpin-helix domain-containing protein [Niabella sp.]